MITKQSFRILLILAAILLVESVSRPEFTTLYHKTLWHLKRVTEQKSSESTQKYNILYYETRNNLADVVNRTQTHINSLRANISEEMKLASGQSCLVNLQYEAGRLSTSILNSCTNNGNFSTLNGLNSDYSIVGSVLIRSIVYCQYLNQLDTQDESYKKCILDTIADLTEQIFIIEQAHEQQIKKILTYNIDCLTQSASNIFAKIAEINYEIRICHYKRIGLIEA